MELLLLLLLLRCGALASVLLVAQTRPGRLTPAAEQVLAILSSGRDRRHRLRRGGLRAAAQRQRRLGRRRAGTPGLAETEHRAVATGDQQVSQ